MTSESSEPDEDLGWHKVMDRAGWEAFWADFDGRQAQRDRALDDIVRMSEGLYGEWDDEPTHEKYRRGAKWR
jgi:hypothetical protein